MKYYHFLIAVLFFPLNITAQEVLFPLSVNPVLTKLQFNPSTQRRAAVNDTAFLPFIEDFSLNSVYPTDSLWTDRNVFINNNYSADPVTIGIATFDGLNEFGQPYHPSSTADSIADYLTSRPIRLQQVPPGDTSLWLSFFYQPQGLGDCPEAQDSLVLQFKDTSETWTTVWSVPGRCDTAFKRINIRIADAKYFFDGFQFRFYNIATVNGNRDHWNLDYVIIRLNTIENAPISDFGFIHPQQTMIKEYTSMPYSHYKVNGMQATMMKTTMDDTIRNFDYGPSAVAPFISVTDDAGTNTVFTLPSTIVGLNLLSDTGYTIPLNGFQFPVNPEDSASFLVKSYSDSPPNQNNFNDSSFYYQDFYNYYSYDNGSAESSYGLTGNTDVWAAYQFDIKKQDTLRGVQIYFNPTGIDITNKLFQLTVWSDVNVTSNTSVEMYRLINQKPDTFDGINVFKTYLFDSLLVVGPGNIWVGMIQNEPQTLYGIGFDRNTDSRDKMFYHIDGFWYQSQLAGSWMIRPLFGRDISLVGINEAKGNSPAFSLYPNPATHLIHLRSEPGKECRYQIYDLIGSLISDGKTSGDKTIDVSSFAKGMYVVKLSDADNGFSTRKFIID